MTRTRPARLTRRLLWHWRANPLRRPSDRVEAWIVLIALIVALAGGLLVGLVSTAATQDALDARRAAVHPVSAVLTENAPQSAGVSDTGVGDGMVWATVRWTDADGVTRTSRAKVEPGGVRGAEVTVWSDGAGRLVAEPTSAVAADLEAVFLGGVAGLATAGTALLAARLARVPLDRRRMRAWETEWAQVGPRWRKRMSG